MVDCRLNRLTCYKGYLCEKNKFLARASEFPQVSAHPLRLRLWVAEQIYWNIPTNRPVFQQNSKKDSAVTVEYYPLFVHENEKSFKQNRKNLRLNKIESGKNSD